MNLPYLPVDKANHFVYGAAIFVTAYTILLLIPNSHVLGLSHDVAMWAVTGFAVGKEIVDRLINLWLARNGQPATHGVEVLDALATMAGGGTGWASAHLAFGLGGALT